MPIYCTNCGNELSSASKFCNNCGAKLPGTAPVKVQIPEDTEPMAETETNEVSAADLLRKEALQADKTEKESKAVMQQPQNTTIAENTEEPEDDIMVLRNKANSEIKEKGSLNVRKVIIGILCVAILAAGGVLTYLLLDKDEGADDPSSKQAVTAAAKNDSSSEQEASSDDTDTSSETNLVKSADWEFKDIPDPASLKTKTVSINGYDRMKFVTGINTSFSKLYDFFENKYPEKEYTYKEVKDENVYSRMKQSKEYTGLVRSYLADVSDKTEESVAEAAFSETTAYFEGLNEFKLKQTYKGSKEEVQTRCLEELKGFMDEELAEYMVYGRGNDISLIDEAKGSMNFTGSFGNQGINAELIRTVTKNENSYTVEFSVKYAMSEPDKSNLFFDTASSDICDSSELKISDFIPGTKEADYKSSHKFMTDIVGKLLTDSKKLVDTKMSGLNAKELINGKKIKTQFSFNVNAGLEKVLYEDAPGLECEMSAVVNDGKIESFDIGIMGVTKTTDIKEASKITANTVNAMYPDLKIKADDIQKALDKDKKYSSKDKLKILNNEASCELTVFTNEDIVFSIHIRYELS